MIERVPAPPVPADPAPHYNVEALLEQLNYWGCNTSDWHLLAAAWVIEELTGHPHPEWRLREINERIEGYRARLKGAA